MPLLSSISTTSGRYVPVRKTRPREDAPAQLEEQQRWKGPSTARGKIATERNHHSTHHYATSTICLMPRVLKVPKEISRQTNLDLDTRIAHSPRNAKDFRGRIHILTRNTGPYLQQWCPPEVKKHILTHRFNPKVQGHGIARCTEAIEEQEQS